MSQKTQKPGIRVQDRTQTRRSDLQKYSLILPIIIIAKLKLRWSFLRDLGRCLRGGIVEDYQSPGRNATLLGRLWKNHEVPQLSGQITTSSEYTDDIYILRAYVNHVVEDELQNLLVSRVHLVFRQNIIVLIILPKIREVRAGLNVFRAVISRVGTSRRSGNACGEEQHFENAGHRSFVQSTRGRGNKPCSNRPNRNTTTSQNNIGHLRGRHGLDTSSPQNRFGFRLRLLEWRRFVGFCVYIDLESGFKQHKRESLAWI